MRIFALSLSAILLSGCGSSEPVPEDGELATEPMEVADDLILSDRENLPNGQSDITQAAGGTIDGAGWTYKEDSRTAIYGPPNSEGALAIQCAADGKLVVTRYAAAPRSAVGVLTFSGNQRSASVAVSAKSMEIGPDYVWQGNVSSDRANFRAVFENLDGQVEVQPGSGKKLIVSSSEAPLKAIDACA